MAEVVVFGAGAVGRGFIGPLFSAAGWGVTFVDVAPEIVERLDAEGGYDQAVVATTGTISNRVSPVRAVLLGDEAAVAAALGTADLVATAVGADNVAAVVPALVAAAERRALDVLLCENLHEAPTVVRGMLDAAAGRSTDGRIGLLATSIGRMIPSGVRDPEQPTLVAVEPYAFLPYDASALVGPAPAVPGLIPIRDGFDAYEDRKLYVHNMGHFMLGCLGRLEDLTYTWEAVGRLDLRYLVRAAMVESAMALSVVHGLPTGPLLDHVGDLLHRFGNRALGDTNDRVGRDPERKLQPGDRLLGAYQRCLAAGVAPLHLSLAVALGAHRLAGEAGWSRQRVAAHLDEHLFTADVDPALRQLFADQLTLLDGGLDVTAQVARIDEEFAVARVV